MSETSAPSPKPRPTLVVGYDGSEASRAALLYAARQAGSHGLVIIVHSYALSDDLLRWPNYGQLLSERRALGRSLLDELPLADGALAGPRYETELIGGPAAPAIADVALDRHADEIVVGARGVGRLRALLGSVTTELLHLADRPVVVIPTAGIRPD